jgi:hypothetical protein
VPGVRRVRDQQAAAQGVPGVPVPQVPAHGHAEGGRAAGPRARRAAEVPAQPGAAGRARAGIVAARTQAAPNVARYVAVMFRCSVFFRVWLMVDLRYTGNGLFFQGTYMGLLTCHIYFL